MSLIEYTDPDPDAITPAAASTIVATPRTPTAVATEVAIRARVAAPVAATEDVLGNVRRGWALRVMRTDGRLSVVAPVAPPRAGDVVITRVTAIANHSRLVGPHGERLRLWPGDLVAGVMGARYATDAFEGDVADWDPLHMLTNAAMIGTVRSQHAGVRSPTRLELVGVLARDDRPINLKDDSFAPAPAGPPPAGVLLVIGAGMNSGKTTSTARLVRGLSDRGVSVAALKVTGSVSSGDRGEFVAAGAAYVRDFSDYGFPSTYRCETEELLDLYIRMTQDAAASGATLIIVEIADGVLQPETQAMLADPTIRDSIAGVVATAGCAASSLALVSELVRLGHDPLVLTGIIGNAPLFVREFEARSSVPVVCNSEAGRHLASHLLHRLGLAPAR